MEGLMKKRKIYLAARYSRKDEMAILADRLKDDGHEITSKWNYGNEAGMSREAVALMDYEDVERADTLVLFTERLGSYNRGGGRHFEFGEAYALNKDCFVVGEQEHVFCHLPKVIQFNSFEECREHFRK
jgi:hypothetical protein